MFITRDGWSNIFYRVLLNSALRAMVKDSNNENFVLEIQVFTFFLAIITQLFDANLLILVL